MELNLTDFAEYDNITDSDYEFDTDNKRLESYIVPVLFAIIFIVGVLGNGTIVLVFIKHRDMLNGPNTYILSLTLASLLLLVTSLPFYSIIHTLESWPWGTAVCKLSETTFDVYTGVSVFTLTALSVKGCRAVANTHQNLQIKPLTVKSAMLIWGLASLFALPSALVNSVHVLQLYDNKYISICMKLSDANYREAYQKYSTVAKALIYYILPLCIIAWCYIVMAQQLHVSTTNMSGEFCGEQRVAQVHARRHLVRMVLIFVLGFFICFLPLNIMGLWFHLSPTSVEDYNGYWHVLNITGFCLSFLYSSVNPVVLYCISGVFRQHFNRYLCCQNCKCLQSSTFARNNDITLSHVYHRERSYTNISALESHESCHEDL